MKQGAMAVLAIANTGHIQNPVGLTTDGDDDASLCISLLSLFLNKNK